MFAYIIYAHYKLSIYMYIPTGSLKTVGQSEIPFFHFDR